jgi:(S)-ureidoglycine aminohydrolase
MEIAALTRSVVKRTHALISDDGRVNSVIPGWTGCIVNVIINEQMGARFCQTIVTFNRVDGMMGGKTVQSQLFLYVVEGKVHFTAGSEVGELCVGQYIYIPPGVTYRVTDPEAGAQLLTFQKQYEKIDGVPAPNLIVGDAAEMKANLLLNDPAVRMQLLLPDSPSFDMAINILTFDPGGYLPLVETHVMEHGLLYLRGQGIYRLDQDWYSVKKGDCIWMAPYCQQWCAAIGKEPAAYIFYKDVNRFLIPE